MSFRNGIRESQDLNKILMVPGVRLAARLERDGLSVTLSMCKCHPLVPQYFGGRPIRKAELLLEEMLVWLTC